MHEEDHSLGNEDVISVRRKKNEEELEVSHGRGRKKKEEEADATELTSTGRSEGRIFPAQE